MLKIIRLLRSRFTGEKVFCDDYFLRSRFIQTCFDITPMQQRLVPCEKYICDKEALTNLADISNM